MNQNIDFENQLKDALSEFSPILTWSNDAYQLKAEISDKKIKVTWPYPLMEVFFDFSENGNSILSESIEFYENETISELRDYLIYIIERFFNFPTRIEIIGRFPMRKELQVNESDNWENIFD